MKKILSKTISLCLLFCMLLLCSCTSTSIQSYSDELVSSVWSTKLDNDTQIMLCFDDDNATLSMKQKSDKKLVISGFCEVSDNIFVIYDEKTKTPYAFEYIVHFDRVCVKIFTNTVSLYKT